jgi:hypothetical protein
MLQLFQFQKHAARRQPEVRAIDPNDRRPADMGRDEAIDGCNARLINGSIGDRHFPLDVHGRSWALTIVLKLAN